jgi:acyl-CoA synthetase (AMP-forming)/AMP-acid ligase II
MMIGSGEYPSVRQYAFGDLLREHRRSRPEMPFCVDGDVRLTYRELDIRVNKLVTALKARGVGNGSRLLWLGQNSFKVVELLFAAAKLGAAVCPANWRGAEVEIRGIIEDFDPAIVFWQEGELVHTHGLASEPAGRLYIQHDGNDSLSYEALIAEGRDEDDCAPVDADSPLLAIYTSAFTGQPGAAMLSHNAVLLNAVTGAQSQAIDETTVYLISGPMFHVAILRGCFSTLICGGKCVFLARMVPEELVRLLHDERPTHAMIPKPVLDGLREANKDGRYDLSSLFAKPDLSDWSGATCVPAHAPRRLKPGGYGQTEVMGMATMKCWGGEAGRPGPFISLKIVDDEGLEVPTGTVGEIAIKGPMVMNGYYNRPELNAGRAKGGWHLTHDLGVRLADGSVAFVGPKTTMIKTGVENVYPVEVEACLKRHPAVADVCIIGVPDPKWDQNVKAVVVLKPGTAANATELISHCRQHLASYKKPKIVTFVDKLPKTEEGFVDRAAVDAQHGGGGYPSFGKPTSEAA